MIHLKGVKKIYGDGPDRLIALDLPEASFAKGSQWALMGPSGSGKSTLLHCLAGILSIDEGSIETGVGELQTLSSTELQVWRQTYVGYVFQDFNLINPLTVEENIELAAYFRGIKKDTAYYDYLHFLMDAMDIRDLADSYPIHLSRGEQQRVAVARALVKKPHLVLADEPTACLDELNSCKVMELLTRYCRDVEATLLVATHDSLAQGYCAHTLELHKPSSKFAAFK